MHGRKDTGRKSIWGNLAERWGIKPKDPIDNISTWDRRWMDMALLVAEWSKDLSRKTGAVIVDDRNVVVSLGWNGFPRGVDDSVEERYQRPEKYPWTEHAERNAIFNAAANGHKTRGCTIYIPWFPCSECARAIIQAGIAEVVCIEPDWSDPTWAVDFEVAREMLAEANMQVRFMSEMAPPVAQGYPVAEDSVDEDEAGA